MYAPILLFLFFSKSLCAFDPSNPLNLPIPLPLDASAFENFDPKHIDAGKLAKTFQSLIPKKQHIGLPSHASQSKNCVKFCHEHKRMCGMLKLGSSISENLCDKEYMGCVKASGFPSWGVYVLSFVSGIDIGTDWDYL
ncbi:hypothetical protein FKW77_010230 [Venturia effusa]|uniref:Uncharacterized protein n=1 Tax=Venturia effusa TaxID=50376 RepID=A0A517L6C5_9PEZI|nr:hypothetical protein FKW77_010230 [Venturia effusa]